MTAIMNYPDVTNYKGLLAYIKATNETLEADKLADRLGHGTTCGRDCFQVMFLGEKVALVKRRSSSWQGSNYPGYVMVVSLVEQTHRGTLSWLALNFEGARASEVWSLDTSSEKPASGRLQGQNLRDLVAKAVDLDKNYDARRAPMLAAKKAAYEQAKATEEAAKLAAEECRDKRDALQARVEQALTAAGFTAAEIGRVCVLMKEGA